MTSKIEAQRLFFWCCPRLAPRDIRFTSIRCISAPRCLAAGRAPVSIRLVDIGDIGKRLLTILFTQYVRLRSSRRSVYSSGVARALAPRDIRFTFAASQPRAVVQSGRSPRSCDLPIGDHAPEIVSHSTISFSSSISPQRLLRACVGTCPRHRGISCVTLYYRFCFCSSNTVRPKL